MLVTTRTELSTTRWIDYLFILTLFIPDYFKTSSGLAGYFYWPLEAVRIAGSMLFIFRVFVKKRINQVFLLCVLFHLTIFISTLVNHAGLSVYRTLINTAFPTLGVMAFIECRKNTDQLLINFKTVLEVLLVINFVYMLIHPDGVYIVTRYNNANNGMAQDIMSYFLTSKNRFIMWILPLAVILEIEKNEKKINLKEYFFFVFIMFATLLFVRSITSLVSLGIFYLGCICFEKNKLIRLTIGKILILYVVTSLLFMVFNIQNQFSGLIVGILGKNLLLQGRVYIWQIALQMIREHLIMGYGNAGNGTIISWNGYMWYAHNLALDILIQGGLIALGIMLLVVVKLIYMEKATLQKNREEYGKVQIVNIGIASFLLLGIFESYLNYPQFFMMIALSSIFMESKYIRFVTGK